MIQDQKSKIKDQRDDELKKQLDEVTEHWKRALADYQNLEKRTREEKLNFAQFANSQLILKFLAVLDALDQLSKLDQFVKDEHLQLIIKQFRGVLSGEGLEKLEVLGKSFNPQEMECLEVVEGEDGQVMEETRAGYKLKGKILRVAQVKVGKNNLKEE